MARDHARILTAIWRDEDFRALTVDQQHTYLAVVSQQALTYAGVLDYRPGRLAALAKDNTPARVAKAVKSLERPRFLLVDRETEELLARSYVRHDGVMNRLNMGKAVARAVDEIVSLPLRRAVLEELARLYGDKPALMGWGGFAELNPDAMDTVTAMASTIPFPMASPNASKGA